MRADSLLSALAGARRTGVDRWIARCPAHKDRRASLSVRQLDDGRMLVHCFAGCDVGSVVAAAGLQLEDLFPPRPHQAGGGRPAERRPFAVRDLIGALSGELQVAWVILADVAAGRELSDKDRARAALARDRCAGLIDELRDAR